MRMNYKPQLVSENGVFRFIDSDDGALKSRKVERLFECYRSYFENFNDLVLSAELNYSELAKLLDKVNSKINTELEIDSEARKLISKKRYSIEEQRMVGITIKQYDNRWNNELKIFRSILDREITRPLKSKQIQASFFLSMMRRAANFSVPGAGKTAMMYATFAYLSAPEINEVNKIVIISPLNAFEAWRTEFKEVFGEKRELHFMNLKNYNDASDIRTNWGIANVIILNYESLAAWKLSVLNELINEKTIIVFDEVHRVKNPEGKRAKNALELGKNTNYHYVLTGTPIPNSYKDIYNFLHLLYGNEYNTFFGWNIIDLENADFVEINKKLQPFFWRTNKNDLKIPPADEDNILGIMPNTDQEKIVKTIYEVESNVLGRYIRLLQASTNPALLTEKIDFSNLKFMFDETNFSIESSINSKERNKMKKHMYLDLGVNSIRTPKFERGMQLIHQLVCEGKKVIVWGMFVGTMLKIHEELNENGINANLIYGATPKESRVELINEFRDGNVQVLISNPATLGESISLHQSVHDAIYFEYNFNLTFMLQSRDRIHRLGLASNQYTRYYYLMTEGDSAHNGFVDRQVYNLLKEKESRMLNAIDGEYLLPEVSDDYLSDIKKILLGI